MNVAPLLTDLNAWAYAEPSTCWQDQDLHWHLWSAEVALPRRGDEPSRADRRKGTPQHMALNPADAADWLAQSAVTADARATDMWTGKSVWAGEIDWMRAVVRRTLAAGRLDVAAPSAAGTGWHLSTVRVSESLAVDLWALEFTAQECPGCAREHLAR